MPNELNEQQLRQWYAKFAKELYEKGNIDVTRKEDLGRVKNFDIQKWDADDPVAAVVDFSYAYMPRNENGYLDPMPDVTDFKAYSEWMMRNMNADVTLDQIRTLYNQSRNGTLMIFLPGESLHNMRQVYTDEQGNLITSLSGDQYDTLKEEEIPEELRIPEQPARVYPPDLSDYFRGAPMEPDMPKVYDLGFWSWLGYLFGRDTDYAKMVQYKKEMADYVTKTKEFMDDLPNKKGDLEGYRKALAEHEQNFREAPKKAKAFMEHHLGKFYAIDRGIRDSIPFREDSIEFNIMLDKETKFLEKQHENTPLGQMSQALHQVDTLLHYPDRTKKVVRNLVGSAPETGMLYEWVTMGVFKLQDYRPQPYDIPKPPEYKDMSLDDKHKFDKKWSAVAEIAGFAAIADPEVSAKKLTDGLNAEETAQSRYGMILSDLFTRGRPAGKQHMDVLEPARQKAKEALESYITGNDPKPLATLLARSLEFTNREARLLHNLNDAHNMDTLYLVGRLYDTLTADPKLMEAAGLKQEELEEAQANIALYQVARQGQMAKKAILEHSLYRQELSQEQLLEAAKDMMFANVIARELQVSFDKSDAIVLAMPEQQRNQAVMVSSQKYTALMPMLKEAQTNNDTETAERIQADMDMLKREGQLARHRFNLMDLQRPAHALNRDLMDPKWVAALKDQIADNMDLSSMITGSREEIGKRFAQDSKLMAKLDTTVLKFEANAAQKSAPEMVAEAPKLEEAQPEKANSGMMMS